MAKLVINSYEEFASHLGEKLGESDWLLREEAEDNPWQTGSPFQSSSGCFLLYLLYGEKSTRCYQRGEVSKYTEASRSTS